MIKTPICSVIKKELLDFLGGTVDENPPANAGNVGSIPAPGRFHMLQSTKACGPKVLSPRAATSEADTL